MAALIQIKDGVDGITLRIEHRESRLGRGSNNDITINDELVSKQHAEIIAEQSEANDGFIYTIMDCGSTNGTFVNDKKISEYTLKNGDVIRIGINHFRFVDDANDDLAATTKIQKTWIPGVFITRRNKK
ncbi:FHA domain-containing protein [Kaarinaea lacus]|jgi:pSer/pThr/pTyr-binding forkhead associated (FHA) protein